MRHVLLLAAALAPGIIQTTTLVYNIKLRRAVIAGSFMPQELQDRVLWLVTGLPIVYVRDRTLPIGMGSVHEHTQLGGALFNVRAITPSLWWAEISTGLEEQIDTLRHGNGYQHLSRTGLDDILITIGKNTAIHDRAQLAGYGLVGFPTRWCVTAPEVADPLVGSRFFGMGFGAEYSQGFVQSARHALVGFVHARFVHFFNRPWYPILPCGAQIEPGNITDLFFILRYRHLLHVLEAGYNATWFTQQGVFSPPTRTQTQPFLRNSLYLNYIGGIVHMPGIRHPCAVGMGINIGRASALDTRIFAWWFNLSVLF